MAMERAIEKPRLRADTAPRQTASPDRSLRKDGATGLPRYAQVANDLIARIASGEYPVGSLLPSEIELSSAYGISRHTMREALRRLNEAGLLSRRRRAGTEIVATRPARSYRQPISSIDDLLQYGGATEIRQKRLKVVRCNAALAGLIGCETGKEWLRVDSIRTEPGDAQPICRTTLYLTLELTGIEANVARHSGPVSAMIEEVYGIRIAQIEQSIEAISLDAPNARRLRSEPGAPALKATRRYYDHSGRLIELAVALHPGNRFIYTTRLQRT
jgi:GntR family transcriptional regulator